MKLAKYLGKNIANLLEDEPFKSWPMERWPKADSIPPVVGYEFEGLGLEINCDFESEKIRSLFIGRELYQDFVLSELSFSSSRLEVLSTFGTPSESGEKVMHPAFGVFGAWDLFVKDDYSIHIQFKVDETGIDKITLMRNDVVP